METTFTITSCQGWLDPQEVSVEQLQLLDATTSTTVAVPVDAKTRSEVIDLMARILVAVFQIHGEKSDESSLIPSQS